MKKKLSIITILFFSINCFGQDAAKMKKHLTVNITDKFDKTASVSFGRTVADKHGFDEISGLFKNAFVGKGFIVKDNPQYMLMMDYGYVYVISAYRMQYSNLKAEIIDMTNNKTIVATIVYDGRFETDALSLAVAEELSKAAPLKAATQKTISVPASSTKTKEERLTELKQFYEKQLITKEEYEESKRKILAE